MHDDEHPLLVELVSLRQTAARFQHEAHAAAIKLQRHTLDVSRIHEHAAALEQENAGLIHEIGILRAHPDVLPHPAVAQVQELSLALRRLSDKIDLTEQTLLERTSELAQARNELARARQTADGAYELAARMRAREEAAKARERELELKARASEEERKMVDLVVQEYADLVRNLEGRKSARHPPSITNGTALPTTPLVDILQDSKSNLHRMLGEFSTESKNLYATIAELNTKTSMLQTTLDAERITASHDRALFSQTKYELDKLNLEDQTAAKMVTRYMKFSQASTNALQQQITTLKTRHASTIATLELQLSIAESQLQSERVRTARLQDALDELCQDLARESYGRRREVALRLALLSREEGTAELMRRWVRRARELYARYYNATPPIASEDAVQEAFHRVVTDGESILSALDDGIQLSDGTPTSGAQARIVLSRAAVDALRGELQGETQKRIEAVRQSALYLPNSTLNEAASGIENPAQPDDIPPPSGNEALEQPLPTSNGNALLEYSEPPVEPPLLEAVDSPVLVVGAPEEIVDDPFVITAPATHSTNGITEHTIVHGEMSSLVSASIQETSSASVTLVNEGSNTIQPHTPAAILDLQEDIRLPFIEEHSTANVPTADMALIHSLPSDSLVSTPAVQPEGDTVVPSTSMSTSTVSKPHAILDRPSPINAPPALLSELGATKHRYDALQRAFRDCSVALKELKRTLASSSPSPHNQAKLGQHLEVALARIDDYAEDARVELEIRVADEELTVRGFEMVLSVPAALVDADERAEAEVSARMFVDGTDEGVTKALDKFGTKLENVQHDVAVVKRAIHGLAFSEGNEDSGESKESGAGSGWTAWTAGLLGATATPSRSPTPVQTFGTVMTSPRLRHAASSKQLCAQGSTEESTAECGPLARLNFRIPMPMVSPSPSHPRWGHLGLGRVADGETPPRTLSAMYAVGGLRSSSIRLGVGLSGSPSPAPSRGIVGLGMRMRMGSVSSQGHDVEDIRGTDEGQDLGGVE